MHSFILRNSRNTSPRNRGGSQREMRLGPITPSCRTRRTEKKTLQQAVVLTCPYGVSRRRQRISSTTGFCMSIETYAGIADTITCPLSSAPDGGCLSCELVASPGWRLHVWPRSRQWRHGSEIAQILGQSWHSSARLVVFHRSSCSA